MKMIRSMAGDFGGVYYSIRLCVHVFSYEILHVLIKDNADKGFIQNILSKISTFN